jgi:hypothetical protein
MAAAVVGKVQNEEDGTVGRGREEVRARWLAEIPWWYSPWGHLAFPSVVGLGTIAVAIHAIHHLQAWQAFTVPAVLLLSNAVEWRVHKQVLHRRTWPLEELYDQHTPNHHRVFVTEDMVIRSPREFRFVLMPFYAIVALFFLTAPLTLVLLLVGQPNVAALFVVTSMAYVLSYEWLHLAYHLPPESFVGRMVGTLRRHHAIHHDPSLMQKWNFNVTIPLWDWVRGTIHRATRSKPGPS